MAELPCQPHAQRRFLSQPPAVVFLLMVSNMIGRCLSTMTERLHNSELFSRTIPVLSLQPLKLILTHVLLRLDSMARKPLDLAAT
ncbi:hypothetical protein F4775DRAFT_555465 [Biscogniauxia sp. FL1348]|nr:hypothetical protein F4775DRAFT_555465 [Biscogniauxia sp. FL1348]